MLCKEPVVYNITETAHQLGISRKHTYSLIRTGQLPAHRIGKRQIRVSRSAVEDFMHRNTIVPEDRGL